MAAKVGPKTPSSSIRSEGNGDEIRPWDARASHIQNSHDQAKAVRKNNHRFRFSDLICFIVTHHFFYLYISYFDNF
jgi:hypothetical protein